MAKCCERSIKLSKNAEDDYFNIRFGLSNNRNISKYMTAIPCIINHMNEGHRVHYCTACWSYSYTALSSSYLLVDVASLQPALDGGPSADGTLLLITVFEDTRDGLRHLQMTSRFSSGGAVAGSDQMACDRLSCGATHMTAARASPEGAVYFPHVSGKTRCIAQQTPRGM